MPVVAVVDGVKIVFYANEHLPAHFHALIAEHRAVIDIVALRVTAGSLPAGKRAKILLGRVSEGGVAGTFRRRDRARESGAYRMKKLASIVDAQPVIHGVLKVAFADGYEGIVDLRPLIAKGKVFSWLSAPSHFVPVKVDEFGHSVSWLDDQGYTIDLSADSIRRGAERQAGDTSAHGQLSGAGTTSAPEG
jgi:hypothetical protein